MCLYKGKTNHYILIKQWNDEHVLGASSPLPLNNEFSQFLKFIEKLKTIKNYINLKF